MRIYALVNQKGGVGKTTTTLNVGAGLAAQGKAVLLIDADQSGNLSKSAGIELADDAPTLYEVLKGAANINDAIQGAQGGKYAVLPADSMLSGADVELSTVPGREMLLKEAIAQLSKPYDYVLIDCPPSLNTISLMALTAAGGAIVPVQAHYLALDGIAQLNNTIGLVRKRMNPQLEICGILVTLYDARKLLNKDVLDSLTAAFPGKVYATTISNNIALAEAPSYGKDIFAYKPKSKGAEQYRALTAEILEREGTK